MTEVSERGDNGSLYLSVDLWFFQGFEVQWHDRIPECRGSASRRGDEDMRPALQFATDESQPAGIFHRPHGLAVCLRVEHVLVNICTANTVDDRPADFTRQQRREEPGLVQEEGMEEVKILSLVQFLQLDVCITCNILF